MTETQEHFLDATRLYLAAMPTNFEVRDAAQSLATVLDCLAGSNGWTNEQIVNFCEVLAGAVCAGRERERNEMN
jgi:hypothetical protein